MKPDRTANFLRTAPSSVISYSSRSTAVHKFGGFGMATFPLTRKLLGVLGRG